MKRISYAMIVLSFLHGFKGCASKAEAHTINVAQLSQRSNLVPIAVIGSGPAGLMAGTYGARGGKKTYIIEGNKPGGLLMDTTEVENWPGEISITGPKIIEKLHVQAETQGVQFIQDAVAKVDTSQWPYRIELESGTQLHALSIIIATGASPRKLGVPGEETYWGSGVTSCAVCDAPFFKNEEVVVIGGGDSAVEEAIQLSAYAKKITILVRKNQMRAASTMYTRLKQYPKIEIKYDVEVKEIKGDLENVTGVLLLNHETGKTELFETSGVFLAIGHIPNSGFIKNVVKTDAEGNVVVIAPTHDTSVPGIFAAGDIEDKVYRQAGSSAGRGSSAALDAVRFLEERGYNNQVAEQLSPHFYTEKKEGALGVGTVSSVGSLEELAQFIDRHSGKLVVLDFWTETCSSCKQLFPLIEKAAQERADTIVFASVDADAAEDIAEQYNVIQAPTLIVIKDGQVIEQLKGFLPTKKELDSTLQQLVSRESVNASPLK